MNVLISGAASGIGSAVCEQLLCEGHTVYALDIVDMAKREGLFSFVCDVTKEDELSLLTQRFREEGLSFDVFIFAAGIHKMASFVESELSDLCRVIDVNLMGTMRTCRLFHPFLKERGRVLIVTSEVAPFDPLPFNGLYNVSKTALDAYAQGLRQELNLLGQTVITIRPGAVETPLSASSLVATERLAEETVLFKKQSHHFLTLVKNFMGKPMPPQKLAKTICRAALKRRPKLIYTVHQNLGLRFLSLLPKRWQCSIVKLLLNR